MNISERIKQLTDYAVKSGLIEEADRTYITNSLMIVLDIDEYEDNNAESAELEEILCALCDYAVEKGIINDDNVSRDLFDTKLMGVLTPRPSAVISKFSDLYEKSPKEATDWYYDFSKNTDYIRTYRIKKDVKWVYSCEYGDIDITINLSKPEKDPRSILLAKKAAQSGYPKCQLCREAEGYSGRMNYPARENHRIIPIKLAGEDWFMQYSPYVYYNEHCIALSAEHTPMNVNINTVRRALDFVTMFPHYFIGSNAGLPIVGGSILAHDHMQGGNYNFAMAKAPIRKEIVFKGFENVKAGLVKWPMSVIRMRSSDRESLEKLASHIFDTWQEYTDESAFVLALTNGEKHNAITPIARMRDGEYEVDLVLRNNITTEECPLGYYHPHADKHNIKKENIGLIEVMGLAVLPSRLKAEMSALKEAILNNIALESNELTEKHAEWTRRFIDKYDFTKDNIDGIIEHEIGKTFVEVLSDSGVFKDTEDGRAAFDRYIAFAGGQ